MDIALKEENFENPELKSAVVANNPLKELFVTYVGNKLNPKDDNVTVEMIVEVLAEEFPEFVLALAEENFIRGYKQAFADIESSQQQEQKKTKKSNKRHN
jgi:hypothetical protein